jgi:hypothetical protein
VLPNRTCIKLANRILLCWHLQEAASLKDPFSTHVVAPDTEAVVELDKEVLSVFESDRPNHDKIEKLLTMQVSSCCCCCWLGVGK